MIFSFALFIIVFFSLAILFYIFIFISFVLKIMIPFMFWGAVYAESKNEDVSKMIEFAEIKPGQKAVDLGAGDGRIVIALAQNGVEAHGYEINPVLVWKATKKIKKSGLHKMAFMHWGNFWNKNLSGFDIITVFGITFIMKKLEKKLQKELKNDAKIISNYFCFPDWQPQKRDGQIYLYIK